jgi:eukaryotic-like serine/threonine-protein kinase
MNDDPLVDQLLEELLESGGSPEEACRTCPELLPKVRTRLQRLRRLEEEVGALLPPANDAQGGILPTALTSAELPHISGYEVLEVLGRGGMGVVYAARHLRLGRSVALKMLLAGPFAGPQQLERFLREAQAVAGLRHPNVVQLFDVGEVDGRPYFTMELVEGGSLALKLAESPLPGREAAALAATVAEAVQAAHQSGIVHRDLKPGNILLTADGRPKVTDFGLARRLTHEGELTLSGAPIGTPSYMAPEQARGDNGAIGPTTDVYALGAILYECLTGRRPFHADTTAATLQQVLTTEPVPPTRLNPRVPRDLETICLKCMQKEPPRRYASAQAVADDLHRFERREPILARPLGRLGRLAGWARRRPTAAALCLALLASLLLALALVGGALWMSGQRSATARSAEQDLRDADRLLQQADLAGARAALERAKGRLETGASRGLLERVEQADAELLRREKQAVETRQLVARLDAIRLDRAVVVAGTFNRAQSDRGYETEFRKSGLGTVGDAPKVVAARIAASPVRQALVAALDDWSVCTADPQRRAWLLEAARTADPDSWRDKVRDPQAWNDRAKLRKLAETAAVEKQSLQMLVALGERLQAGGGDRDAVDFLRRVQQAHLSDFYASFMLANALARTNQNEEAIGYYRAAIAIRPDTAAAWYCFGDTLLNLGRLDDAIAALEQSVRLNPTHGWAHADLGSALRRKGRTDEAITHLQLALTLGQRKVFEHSELARALQDKRQWDQAVAQYRAAVKLEPNLASTHFDLGMALRSPHDQDESIEQFRAALAIEPRWPGARANLVRALMERGRFDEAARQLRQAVALAPRDRQAQELLRTVLIRQGRLEEARDAWQSALGAGPSEHDAWFGYAELCLFLDREDDYRRNRRDLLLRFGSSFDPSICERTSRACLLLPGTKDEIDDAAALANRAVAAGRKGREWAYPYCLFAQGLADYRLGRFDEAIALMNGEAAKAAWISPCPRLVMAMAIYRKGQRVQARKVLAAAVISYDWSAAKADFRDPWTIHILRREAEALILPNLPAFLKGEYQPQDNAERLALLGVCQFKDRRAAMAGLYAAAFVADPKLADDLEAGHRYRAACAAILAGCGRGSDAARLNQEERTRWRKKAYDWLRTDLAAWKEKADSHVGADRALAHRRLSEWRTDPDLEQVRTRAALDKLPIEEREQWVTLWNEVGGVLTRVQEEK